MNGTGICKHCGMDIRYTTVYSGWVHVTSRTRSCPVEGQRTVAEPKR